MSKLGWTLLCKSSGGHFYAKAGGTILCRSWGVHFYAKARGTISCRSWGGHFYAKAGVDTFMQKLEGRVVTVLELVLLITFMSFGSVGIHCGKFKFSQLLLCAATLGFLRIYVTTQKTEFAKQDG